jgi:ABC-type Fe3+ transport system substrate-binding protein
MKTKLPGALAIITAAGLLAACGGAATPISTPPGAAPANQTSAGAGAAAGQDTRQSLIDGARKEGQLNLVWGEQILGGSQVIPQIVDAFNKHYGLNIKVQFTPGPNFQEMGAKVLQEYQTQHPATSDVLNLSDSAMGPLISGDALVKEHWTDWAENIKPESVAPEGVGVVVQTYVAGITYNSRKLTGNAVPKSMQDLLKPEYKGRIASTIYASSFDRLSTPTMWGKQATLDYVHKFSQQLGGLIRCPDAQGKLLDGEFDLFALDCNQGNALRAQAKGEPLGFVIPSDAAILSDVYVTVPKNASHPNAAKLYVDFLLSRQAQDMFFPVDYVDSYLLPGSKTAELVNTYKAQGVKFTVSDVRFFQENDLAQMRQNLNQIVEIFQKPNG